MRLKSADTGALTSAPSPVEMLTTRILLAFLAVCFFMGPARAQDQPVRVVVTVEAQKDAAPPNLTKDDVMVYLDNQRMRVTDWTPIQSDRVGLELWLLIDDGTDSSLGTQFDDLHKFVMEQPATTRVGIGYLRNGTVEALQKPTADHALAAKAIRLPLGQPGASASPYLALIDLIQKWPASQQAREVVMVSSGIDPDNGPGPINPYLDRAIVVAQRAGVVVHSIYFGEFFWQGDSNPVSLAPYFKELNQHFDNQHVLTFIAQGKAGQARLKLKTEVRHVMLLGPSMVYVPGGM
jgi:hypothetical protein